MLVSLPTFVVPKNIYVVKSHFVFVHLISPSVKFESGHESGSEFERGGHTIIYSATDSNGASTSCHFSFTIKGEYAKFLEKWI